jgi:proteasome accessory factor A
MDKKGRSRRIFGLESEILPRFFTRKPDGSLDFTEILPWTGPQNDPTNYTNPATLLLHFIRDAIPKMKESSEYRYYIPANECLLYCDRGHVEATTPECLTPKQVTAYSVFLRKFLSKYLTAFNRELAHGELTLVSNSGEFPDEVYSHSDTPYTRGAHENYSIAAEPIRLKGILNIDQWIRAHQKILSSFFVTRQLVCGNGAVYPRRNLFLLSQRSPFILEEIGSSTIQSRGILNTRNEPISDGKHFRLHIIVGDANMSEWSIYLKFALTSLVLSMIEDEFLVGSNFEKIAIVSPAVPALHRVCEDIAGKTNLFLVHENGTEKSISSLEHSVRFLELMEDYGRCVELSAWEKDAIIKYRYILNCIARGDREALADKLDYAIKERLLRHFMQKRNITSFEDPRCAMYDHQYHEVSESRGIFLKLENHGLVQRIAGDRDMKFAENHPPPTRALWRKIITEELLKAKERVGYICSGDKDWQHVKQGAVRVECLDPFATDLKKILDHQVRKIRALTQQHFRQGNPYGREGIYVIYQQP